MISALLAWAVVSPLQEPAFPRGVLTCPPIVDVDGKSAVVSELKFTVLLFVSTDCPIANRMAPEIARIAADYGKKGVTFYRVYPGEYATPDEIRAHGVEYSLPFPGVLDAKFTWVDLVGASVTPQAAIIDKACYLRYRGRINDSYREHGKPRTEGVRNDLRIALDELLAGKAVSMPRTPAVGCFISKP
jgi:hypothetical protein